MANLNDHKSRFRKGLSNPFNETGLMYCVGCKIDVKPIVESRHHKTTYAYRCQCPRCGVKIASGVFDNVVMLTGKNDQDAIDWTEEQGRDRR